MLLKGVDLRILLEGAERSNWQLQEPLNTLFAVLENKQLSDDFLCSIATDFIYEIYRKNILNTKRNILINSLLTTICKSRKYFNFLEKLMYLIERKFYFLPIAKYEIFQLIKIRHNTQIIV